MSATMMIHTDGACSGNPGPGGFAGLVFLKEETGEELITTVTGGDPHSTNNRMELSAVIESLRAINRVSEWHHAAVTVHSDSNYVIKAFNDNWLGNWQKNGWRNAKNKAVENQDLWIDLLRELKGHQATWVWVKGHSGDPMNEACDELAVEQSKRAHRENGYWSTAEGQATTPTEPEEAAGEEADGKEEEYQGEISLQAALDLNLKARTSAELALWRYQAGNREEAWEVMKDALDSLKNQVKVLEALGGNR